MYIFFLLKFWCGVLYLSFPGSFDLAQDLDLHAGERLEILPDIIDPFVRRRIKDLLRTTDVAHLGYAQIVIRK